VKLIHAQLNGTRLTRDLFEHRANYERARRYKEAKQPHAGRSCSGAPPRQRDGLVLLGAIFERQKFFDRPKSNSRKLSKSIRERRGAELLRLHAATWEPAGKKRIAGAAGAAEDRTMAPYLDSLGWVYYKENSGGCRSTLPKALERDRTIHDAFALGDVYAKSMIAGRRGVGKIAGGVETGAARRCRAGKVAESRKK